MAAGTTSDRRDTFVAAHAAADDWRTASAECLAQLGQTKSRANIGFLYVSDRLADHYGDILEFLSARTGVKNWVGTVGIGVCATGTEYFDQPAVTAMIGELPDDGFALFDSSGEDLVEIIRSNRALLARGDSTFGVVHLDPQNQEAFSLIPVFAEAANGFLVGALTSSRGQAVQAAGGVTGGGMSGVLMAGDIAVATGLSQGCSPIGTPHEVTAAEDNIVIELDGRPALEVFKQDIGELLARDLRKVAGYIFAAVPVAGTDWGDYLVRNLTGIDEQQGLIAIADRVESGQSLMFCRRDREAAEKDLRRMLTNLKGRIDGRPRGALYHTCLARGPNMFEGESAELGIIAEELGDVPLVGFFGNGEISNNRLYAYTGVLTLFL